MASVSGLNGKLEQPALRKGVGEGDLFVALWFVEDDYTYYKTKQKLCIKTLDTELLCKENCGILIQLYIDIDKYINYNRYIDRYRFILRM